MAKQWKYLFLSVLVSLLFSAGAYAGSGDLAFDSYQSMVENVPLAVDLDLADDIEAPALHENLKPSLSATRTYSGFLHGSPESMRLTVADTANFRLNRVPWQYFQA